METADKIAEKVKAALESASLSIADISQKSGINHAVIEEILSGCADFSIENINKISQVLGINTDELTKIKLTPIQTNQAEREAERQKIANEHAQETDILANFVLKGSDYTTEEAARFLTSSANGTWVNSWTDQFVDFENNPKSRPISSHSLPNGDISVDMAFPHEMVEAGSITSLISVLGACLSGVDAQLMDVRIPSTLVRTLNAPAYGTRGIRDTLNKHGRPLLSTTIRPMNGLSPKMYGRAIYENLVGGVDFTCDPTMMHSLPGNEWRARFKFAAEAVHTAEERTNEQKSHVCNITAGTVEEMIRRAEYAELQGITAVMVDSAAIGWSALSSIAFWCRDNDVMLFAMGGRSLQSGILSEQLTAKLLRLSGCDVVSMGSPLGGETFKRRRTKGVISVLSEQNIAPFEETGIHFDQPTCRIAESMPAVGGGHNPWHFPRLIDTLGDDVIIQCGGSVMGHPWGSQGGAIAARTAVEALIKARAEGDNLTVNGRKILQNAAKKCDELEMALNHWSEGAFLFGVVDASVKGKVEKK